ncbi:hypothetical protein ACFX2I_039996 [Malus domestica]
MSWDSETKNQLLNFFGLEQRKERRIEGNIRPCPKVQLADFENTDEHGAVDGRVNTDKAMCIGWPCFTFRLDQYTVAKFAESFDTMPKFLEKNAGLNATEIIFYISSCFCMRVSIALICLYVVTLWCVLAGK